MNKECAYLELTSDQHAHIFLEPAVGKTMRCTYNIR